MNRADVKGWERWRHFSARTRFLSGACVGVIAAGFTWLWSPWQLSVLVLWDATALAILAFVWFGVARLDADSTAAFATREDSSRTATHVQIVGASVVSLVGTAFSLYKAHHSSGAFRDVLVAAGVATVVVSWAIVHTTFMLRYAHLYYTAPVGGIDFHSGPDDPPDYRDFAYLAFTVGMTFQVSDTELNHKNVRRTILKHALLSYLFGAVILAVTVNVVANLI